MRKSFEDLTIADDFMFCKIMEHESLCRPFLEMLFTVNIGKITYLSSQNGVITNSAAKQSGLIYWSKTMPVHPMILKCVF